MEMTQPVYPVYPQPPTTVTPTVPATQYPLAPPAAVVPVYPPSHPAASVLPFPLLKPIDSGATANGIPTDTDAVPTAELQAHPLSIGEALRYMFAVTFRNRRTVALPLYTYCLLVYLGSLAFRGVLSLVLGWAVAGVFSHLLLTPILLGLTLGGVCDFCLAVVRGQPVDKDLLYDGTRHFVPMLVSIILTAWGVALGLVCLIVPGLILLCGWAMSSFLVVDKQLTGPDALRSSWALTEGHRLRIFGLAVVMQLLMTTGVGVLFAPMFFLAAAHVYLRLNDEYPVPPEAVTAAKEEKYLEEEAV